MPLQVRNFCFTTIQLKQTNCLRSFQTENFPNGLKLRGGVYFVDSLPKTHSGKFIRKEITHMLKKLFDELKSSDPLIQSYLSDIPDDYKRLI